MIPNGAGGVIVAWVDERAGNQDIYAQRINSFGATTGVFEHASHSAIALARPVPTPSRGSCMLRFTIPVTGRVSLTVHDVSGRRVDDLVNGELAAGDHQAAWDGTIGGQRAANGVYFVRLGTTSGTRTQRIVLMR